MRTPAIALMGLVSVACGAAAGGAGPTTAAGPAAGTMGPAPAVETPPRPLDDEEAARAQAQAIQTHVRARELQSRCDEEGERAACEQADNLFQIAADTWRALEEGRPADETNTEWSFMLAQASFLSGSYDAAAEAAERYLVRGATQWRTQAVRTLVAARERALEAEMLTPRDAPPAVRGQPPEVEALEMPGPIQRLLDARARFVEVAGEGEGDDEEGAGRGYSLANAQLLFRYGHWERAQTVLQPLFADGCAGERAWDGAATSWRILREIALSLGRYDAVQRLGEEVASCDFGDPNPPSCGPDSAHPRCLARTDSVSGRLHGGTQFIQRAENARGAERQRWAGRAGEAFLAALGVEGELDARGRVTALTAAASAFRMAGDSARATVVDQRIVREVDPADLEEVDRPFAIVSVASAVERTLLTAVEEGRAEDVVRLARRLTTAELDLPELSEERARARRVLPVTLAAMGRHVEASIAYGELAAASEDAGPRRDAELSAALELMAAGSCRRATRPLRAFVAAHRGEEGAEDGVVRALWNIAACERPGSRAHAAALEEVAEAAPEGGRGLDAGARAQIAEAIFLLVDRDFDGLSRLRIRLQRGQNVEALVGMLRAELAAPLDRARALLLGYARVERLGVGRWTVAARYRSGMALSVLERAVLAASWELPEDLQRQRRELNATAFAQLRGIVESRVTEILEAQAALIRCRAAAHLHRAVSVGGTANVESEELLAARQRLDAMEVPERCRSGR